MSGKRLDHQDDRPPWQTEYQTWLWDFSTDPDCRTDRLGEAFAGDEIEPLRMCVPYAVR